MIKKLILFSILSFLFFNSAYAAKKTTYLRCPLMMVENKGTSFASYWKVGDNLNEVYAKVVESKKTKISLHFYMTAREYWKDQKPSNEDGLYKNVIFNKDKDELKFSDSFSDKFKDKTKNEMVEMKFSTSFKFKDDNNEWSLIWLEYNEYIYEKTSSDNIHIKHKLGGDCIVIDKKLYKDFIKNGKL